MTMPSPDGQRIAPALPVGAYKTYQIVAPLKTHFRVGTCEEANCPQQAGGWRTRVDERTELGQKQGHYIRALSGRSFTEERTPDGLTVFTFAAGQQCFAEHRIRLDRPERYVTRPGDWRGNPTGQRPYEHTRPEFWIEDFSENQDHIARQIERG